MTSIGNGCVVSMRYIMKDSKGLVLENTLTRQPITYLHGAPAILPLLQQQLEGLHTGDKKTVYLKAAAGLTTEDFIFEVIIDQVRAALNEEILLGYPVQTDAQPCDADCNCYKDNMAAHI